MAEIRVVGEQVAAAMATAEQGERHLQESRLRNAKILEGIGGVLGRLAQVAQATESVKKEVEEAVSATNTAGDLFRQSAEHLATVTDGADDGHLDAAYHIMDAAQAYVDGPAIEIAYGAALARLYEIEAMCTDAMQRVGDLQTDVTETDGHIARNAREVVGARYNASAYLASIGVPAGGHTGTE